MLAIYEQVYGPDHSDTLTLDGLANLYRNQGKYAEAERLFQRSLAIREQIRGPDHHVTAISLTNLADLYSVQGKYAEAEPLYQRALAIKEQTLFPDHPSIEHTLEQYARLLRQKQHSLKNVSGSFGPGELLNDRFSTGEPIRAIDTTHYLEVFVTSFLCSCMFIGAA